MSFFTSGIGPFVTGLYRQFKQYLIPLLFVQYVLSLLNLPVMRPIIYTFYSLKTCGRKVWSYEAKLSISGSPHGKCQHWIELWTGHCGGKPYILVKCGEALFSADWIRKKKTTYGLCYCLRLPGRKRSHCPGSSASHTCCAMVLPIAHRFSLCSFLSALFVFGLPGNRLLFHFIFPAPHM